jgi:hypothetical protein
LVARPWQLGSLGEQRVAGNLGEQRVARLRRRRRTLARFNQTRVKRMLLR